MRGPATKAKPTRTRAPAPAMARPRLPVWLMAVILGLVTIALYWPATQGGFVNLDDDRHVTANAHVQKGLTWESIKWAMFNPVNCIWHPLTVWSHMLDCQVYGLNPRGHHLTSVLLHAVNTALVFLLLRGLTNALWRSMVVAALFGWHPLHVESVAWVAERKDVLSGFFGLLALIAYVRYAQKSVISSQSSGVPAKDHRSLITDHRSLFYFLSLFFFALGLMSKPMLVTWPFVMLLLDYWPLGRMQKAEGRRQKAEASDTQHATRITPHVSRFTFRVPRTVVLPLLVEKIPFFVLAVAASIVTFVVQKHEGALAGGVNLSLVARGGNALIAYSRYLGKLFWPTHLAVYYPHPGQWPLGTVLLAAGLILGLSVLVWVPRRRYPFLLIGWLWYCGTLVPVSQVVQTGGHAMADRYTYIPLIGALIIVIWAAHELTRRWRYQVLALWAAAGAASIVCLVSTRHQIGYWRDSEALFRHALEVTENNWLAHDELGAALEQKGQMEEAILEFREAVRLNPEFADLQYNLGVALGKKGQTDAAIRQFQEALRLKPDFAEAHNNLGNALRIKGQIGPAIRQFQEALRLQPGYADAHNNLRTALAMKSRIDGAIRQRQEATRQKADGPP